MGNTEWFLMNLTRSRLRASPCRRLSLPITFGMEGSSYFRSQITGGIENAVHLQVDIPRTGGRGSDLILFILAHHTDNCI
jgi:hypothetical protein